MAHKKDPLQTKLEPRYLPLIGGAEFRAEVIREWVDEDHAKLLLLAEKMGSRLASTCFISSRWRWLESTALAFSSAAPRGSGPN